MGLKTEKGFSLIEAAIAMGIMSAVGLGVAYQMRTLMRYSKVQQVRTEAAVALDSVRRLINNDSKWNETLNFAGNNAALDCIKEDFAGACAAGPIASSIILHDIDPITLAVSQPYDSGNATHGIAPDGSFCTTFDVVNGNNACPYRVILSLELQCTGPCIVRNLAITGVLQYRPATHKGTVRFKTDQFIENRVRPLTVNAANCAAYGGTYDGVTNICTLPTEDMICGVAGQAITGIVAGVPICADI